MRFLQEMNFRAILQRLTVIGLIPADLLHSINICASDEECNNELLTYLKEDASYKELLDIFKVASEETSFWKMREFCNLDAFAMRYTF